MWKRVFAATVIIAVVSVAAPVRAAVVTHRDPDDFEIAPDVHSTTRHTFMVDGQRRVRITVRGELGPDYRLRVLIDSRGGPEADFVMAATVRNLQLVTCDVRHHMGARVDAACTADPFRAWWGVARATLAPDGPIRWRIVAFDGPGLRTVTDRAPDTGWYV